MIRTAPLLAKPGVLALPLFKAPAASAAYSWTGFYGGIEGGGTFGQSKQIGQTVDRHTFDSTPDFDVDGGLVGGTLGYNSQFSGILGLRPGKRHVLGRCERERPPDPTVPREPMASTKEDWLATARARIGFTPVDRWLVYATGGLAAADVEASITTPTAAPRSVRNPTSAPGWTAGGGVEAAIIGNWSAKLEYLYVGLQNHAYFVPTPNNPAVTNRAGGVPLNDNIVRGGINYKINWL